MFNNINFKLREEGGEFILLREIKPLENMSKNEIITLINQYSKPGLSRDEVLQIVAEKVNSKYEYTVIYTKPATRDWYPGNPSGSSDIIYRESGIRYTDNGYTHVMLAWVYSYDKINFNDIRFKDLWFTSNPLIMPLEYTNGVHNIIFVANAAHFDDHGDANSQHIKLEIQCAMGGGHMIIQIQREKYFVPGTGFSDFYGLIIFGLKKNFKTFYQNMVKLYNNIINNIRNLYKSPLSLI